jgi:hypothetical protein
MNIETNPSAQTVRGIFWVRRGVIAHLIPALYHGHSISRTSTELNRLQ